MYSVLYLLSEKFVLTTTRFSVHNLVPCLTYSISSSTANFYISKKSIKTIEMTLIDIESVDPIYDSSKIKSRENKALLPYSKAF